MTSVSELDLDLDVFQGPFDLLLAVLLREEISLAEVELGEIVLAYVDHLGETGELDLEAVTEFLVLIAALCELKSRLLLPRDEDEEDLRPEEAADELLARMLEYRRYSEAGRVLAARLEPSRAYIYRSAPPPPELRRAALKAAVKVYEPERVGGRPRRPAQHRRPTPTPATSAPRSRCSGGSAVLRDLLGQAQDARLRRGFRPARTASPRRSPCSRCSSCTAAARRPGRRRRPSGRSR